MITKTPLYYSVMQSIKEDILVGNYPVGTFLPTENELEQQYEVSKITIRKAIELLETYDLIMKKSGHGTTVVSNSLYNKLSKGKSFSHILNEKGFNISKKDTNFRKIPLLPTDAQFNYFGASAIVMDRMYFMDDTPYIYMEHFFPPTIKVPENIEDDNAFSLYMFLYRNGFTLSHFEDSFSVGTPPQAILDKSGLPNEPMMIRTRVSYNTAGTVVETSISYYATSIHPYQINYAV